MLNPIEKFKSSILHLNRDWNHCYCQKAIGLITSLYIEGMKYLPYSGQSGLWTQAGALNIHAGSKKHTDSQDLGSFL